MTCQNATGVIAENQLLKQIRDIIQFKAELLQEAFVVIDEIKSNLQVLLM
jgi:hypothetical protein